MRNILPIFLLQHKNSPNFLTSHTEIDLLYDDASSSSSLAKVHNRTGAVGWRDCLYLSLHLQHTITSHLLFSCSQPVRCQKEDQFDSFCPAAMPRYASVTAACEVAQLCKSLYNHQQHWLGGWNLTSHCLHSTHFCYLNELLISSCVG